MSGPGSSLQTSSGGPALASGSLIANFLEDFLENVEYLTVELERKLEWLGKEDAKFKELKRQIHTHKKFLIKYQKQLSVEQPLNSPSQALSFKEPSEQDAESLSHLSHAQIEKLLEDSVQKLNALSQKALEVSNEKILVVEQIKAMIEHCTLLLDYQLNQGLNPNPSASSCNPNPCC